MPETHARRRTRLREQLAARRLDALLVVDLLNIRYLTGFTGSNAGLLVLADDEKTCVFATDGRYHIQAEEQVPDLVRIDVRRCDLGLAERAVDMGCRRIGYESDHMTVEGLNELEATAEGAELIRAPGMTERLREIKDEEEIDALRAACAAADGALAAVIHGDGLRPGRTERAVARDLESAMLDHGAEKPSFETIVAAGANSAVPHHQPNSTTLETGDFVKIDFGALVDGYHSDMTRTFVVGEPADWQREIYHLVAAAQAAGRAALVAGARITDVDAAARSVITNAGYGEQFSHGLGHGVGLEIHEAPSVGKGADGTLATGMAVTVEPGVYLPGRGGVRIEDTLVVRDGAAELLTLTPKDLVVI